MAMVATSVNTLKFKKGDMSYVNVVLKDYKPMQKTTGVYAKFAAATGLETLGTAIEGASDLSFYGYSGQFQAKDEVKLNTSRIDTPNDCISASFTVKGVHPTTSENLTCSIFIPKSVDPLKVDVIATALKAVDWYAKDGGKLTGITVGYSAVV